MSSRGLTKAQAALLIAVIAAAIALSYLVVKPYTSHRGKLYDVLPNPSLVS